MVTLCGNRVVTIAWESTIICQSAILYGIRTREISFKGALQNLEIFNLLMQSENNSKKRLKLLETILFSISYYKVGNRQGRYEPRTVKYRGKADTFMTVPREEARKRHCPRSRKKKKNALKIAA